MKRVAQLVLNLFSRKVHVSWLIAAVCAVNDIPNAQRLGYILDRVRKRAISDALHDWVERRIERSQPLRPGRPVSGAEEDRRWRLLINSPLEVES